MVATRPAMTTGKEDDAEGVVHLLQRRGDDLPAEGTTFLQRGHSL